MKENNHRFAQREKIYLSGTIYPSIKVGMQKVNLTPTVEVHDGKEIISPNAPG